MIADDRFANTSLTPSSFPRLLNIFSEINNRVMVFTGSFFEPMWEYQIGAATWAQTPVIPTSDPLNGFAMYTDSSTGTNQYYFLGTRCEKFNWETAATNEQCLIQSRVFFLDGATRAWLRRPQTEAPPTSYAVTDSLGGLLNIYPHFCAYDGSSSNCKGFS